MQKLHLVILGEITEAMTNTQHICKFPIFVFNPQTGEKPSK